MKRKMIFAALALLMTSGAANAQIGLGNWTMKENACTEKAPCGFARRLLPLMA